MGCGLMLMRCTPMLLSTAAVNFSYNQYLFLQPFVDLAAEKHVDENHRATINRVLQQYIHTEFPRGFAAILVLYPLTWVTTAAILTTGSGGSRWFRVAGAAAAPLSRASWRLYAVGLAFNIGHILWGPRALGLMEQIQAPGQQQAATSKQDSASLLGGWMRLHVTRSLLADVPGWFCLTAAFVLSRPFR